MRSHSISLLNEAVHHHSAFSWSGFRERLFTGWFGGLFYNQIWEDPLVDMAALKIGAGSRVLTICSGGCNALTYLLDGPESIVSIDLNPHHVHLTRLKLAALKFLPGYEDFFSFFGCANSNRNLDNYYRYLRNHLDQETRRYWEGAFGFWGGPSGPRINLFANNFYNYARLGYFLRFVHALARLLKRSPDDLLKVRSQEEQAAYFETRLAPLFDHPLVRILGRLPFLLFGLGIPPRQIQHLRQESSGNLVNVYRERVRKLACDYPADNNYFMWQAFGRCYDRSGRNGVPEYLKEGNYYRIKELAARLGTLNESLHRYLRDQPAGSLDRFVFLDAQDWMKPEEISDLWSEVSRVGRPGARIVFRTASSHSPVEESLEPGLLKRFEYERDLSLHLWEKDRSAIYGGFHIYTLN